MKRPWREEEYSFQTSWREHQGQLFPFLYSGFPYCCLLGAEESQKISSRLWKMIRLHLFQVNFSLLESYFSLCKSFYIKVKGRERKRLACCCLFNRYRLRYFLCNTEPWNSWVASASPLRNLSIRKWGYIISGCQAKPSFLGHYKAFYHKSQSDTLIFLKNFKVIL